MDGYMPYFPGMPYSYVAPGVDPRYLVRLMDPLVSYGLAEGRVTGMRHAMKQVALIAYLMGCGYDMTTARNIVESWEASGLFPAIEPPFI